MKSREYRMVARADSSARTAEAILAATAEVFWDEPRADLNLEEVARRAGVSVRTVLRKFDSKEGLLDAAVEREMRVVCGQRGQAPTGDLDSTVRLLLEHYEAHGRRVLRLLTAEASSPALRTLADQGRIVHRQWCEHVFADTLHSLPTRDRRRRLAQFVALCDVQTWRLLRVDAGLSRSQAHLSLVEMLKPLIEKTTDQPGPG